MLHIDRVLGSRLEPSLSEQFHRLEHNGKIDLVNISVHDLDRRRLLIRTVGGEELAIALPRHQKLFDGAVLLLDDERAIVVRAATQRWLRLEPRSINDAVELGYHAGNFHWRVRFDGEVLLVALEGPPDDYMARLESLLSTRRVGASVLDADMEDEPGDEAAGASRDHHHHGDDRHGHSH